MEKFCIGQIWESRKPADFLTPDHWRIEAISDHPVSPVLARHKCDALRAFGHDGHYEGEPEAGPLDLVTLIRFEPKDAG